jgi:hypothetical protein
VGLVALVGLRDDGPHLQALRCVLSLHAV